MCQREASFGRAGWMGGYVPKVDMALAGPIEVRATIDPGMLLTASAFAEKSSIF